MNRWMIAVMLLAGSLAGCADDEPEKGCAVDIDCPGDLICENTRCVSPAEPGDAGDSDPVDMSAPDMDSPDILIPDMSMDLGAPDMPVERDMAPDMVPDMTRECVGAPTAAISAKLFGTTRFGSGPIESGLRQAVNLTAANSSNPIGGTLSYTWTVVDFPAGSMASLTRDGAAARFTGDVTGDYTVTLTVESSGVQSCNTATIDIRVVEASPLGLTAVLSWTSDPPRNPMPTDPGVDLDIHYLEFGSGTWNAPDHDIFWDNSTADWGDPGDVNDPILTQDSQNSGGSEIVHHAIPEDKIYYLGAYYYNDSGFGAATATMTLYVDGVMRHQLDGKVLAERGTFWNAFAYDVSNDQIDEFDSISDGFPN